MKTLDHFTTTRGLMIPAQLGRMTLEQAVCLFDALTAIHVCCAHALHPHGGIPAHLQGLVESNGKRSLADSVRVIKLWHRWTHQFHGEMVPDASAVQGFLYALKNSH